jgi:hypothetical protein
MSYIIEYRQKGTENWTTSGAVVTVGTGEDLGSLAGSVTGLTNSVLYEFRFRRGTGPTSVVSNIIEATPTAPTAVVGGTITSLGTFTQTIGTGGTSVGITYVRTPAKLDVTIASANWVWVGITPSTSPGVPLTIDQAYYETKNTGDPNPKPAGIRDVSVIRKISNRTVSVFLPSGYTYVLSIKMTNTDGTVTIGQVTT